MVITHSPTIKYSNLFSQVTKKVLTGVDISLPHYLDKLLVYIAKVLSCYNVKNMDRVGEW